MAALLRFLNLIHVNSLVPWFPGHLGINKACGFVEHRNARESPFGDNIGFGLLIACTGTTSCKCETPSFSQGIDTLTATGYWHPMPVQCTGSG